jgi:hypothetical protein
MNDNLLLWLILFFCALTSILLLTSLFKKNKNVKFVHSCDVIKQKGMFSYKAKVVLKATMFINDVPYGEPIILSTHELSEVDDEKVALFIQTQIIPLISETANLASSVNKLTSIKSLVS